MLLWYDVSSLPYRCKKWDSGGDGGDREPLIYYMYVSYGVVKLGF
jgi:hypothetical protein